MNKPGSTSWGKSSKWYNKIVGGDGHYYHQQLVIPTAVSMLDLKPDSRLLDLGCGQGVLARAIRQDTEYLGLDISGALIEQARTLSHNPRHKFEAEDVGHDLDLENESFSHAAIILAIQNMRNPEKVITNISKLLNHGGSLVIIMNHPCFRIPRQSGWEIDENNKQQKRWINRYMSSMDIPVLTHPSKTHGPTTWSFHHPLMSYVNWMSNAGLYLTEMKELVSDKESVGKAAAMENRSRAEIPLFMALKAVKQ